MTCPKCQGQTATDVNEIAWCVLCGCNVTRELAKSTVITEVFDFNSGTITTATVTYGT